MEKENTDLMFNAAKTIYEYPGTDEKCKAELVKMFPRLKIPENDRIREDIMDFLRMHICGRKLEYWCNWLEKQKEQKPTEWSEEDVKMLKDTIRTIHLAYPYALDGEGPASKNIDWLKDLEERFSLQPKQEWSEEDDMLMDELESYILYDKEFNNEQKSWRIKRLKSLRPQPHWKPSEEQINALKVVVRGYPAENLDAIESLLKDLQKLI